MKAELLTQGQTHLAALAEAKKFFSKCAKDIEKEIDKIGEEDPNADTGKLDDQQSEVESIADDLNDLINDAKKIFK